jgi:hypothetical protein
MLDQSLEARMGNILAISAITPTFAIFRHFCHDRGFSSGKSSIRISYDIQLTGSELVIEIIPTVRESPSSLKRCCNKGARSSRDMVTVGTEMLRAQCVVEQG